MKAKLQHLIKSEGLTASRFAEMLEIQPAGVSHILAGRNKPSFDLLQKILRRFPKINPDWLLLDSEQMYRDGWNAQGVASGSAAYATASGSGANSGSQPSSQNSGMPSGTLFGGVSSNGSTGMGHSATSTFGANNSGMPNGSASALGGGVNGHAHLGDQNLSLGGSNISGMQGICTGLSNSHAGFPVEKIVIFYADGSFEAYSPASRQG